MMKGDLSMGAMWRKNPYLVIPKMILLRNSRDINGSAWEGFTPWLSADSDQSQFKVKLFM
jgi:hypothetical protein